MDIVFGYFIIGLAIATLSEVFFGKVENDEFMSRFLLWPLHLIIAILNAMSAIIEMLRKLLGIVIAWLDKKETDLAINELLEELSQFSRTDLDATTLDERYWVEQEARCGIDRKMAKTKLENFIEKMKGGHLETPEKK